MDTHAGQAWVGLRLRLGEVPPGPLHSQPPHKQKPPRQVGPAQHRRRERRQAARNAAEEVAHCEPGHTAVAEEVPDNIETAAVEATDKEEEVIPATTTKAAEVFQDITNYPCELCESSFKNLRALRAH